MYRIGQVLEKNPFRNLDKIICKCPVLIQISKQTYNTFNNASQERIQSFVYTTSRLAYETYYNQPSLKYNIQCYFLKYNYDFLSNLRPKQLVFMAAFQTPQVNIVKYRSCKNYCICLVYYTPPLKFIAQFCCF